MTESTATGRSALEQLQAADRIHVQQLFHPLLNEYQVRVPPAGEVRGTPATAPLLTVKQKRMKIREDIRFRLDPASEEYLFRIKAKTVFEFRGRYEVLAADETVIGSIGKSFGKSLLRSHWVVSDANGTQLFEAHEQNMAIALIRRFAGFIPYVGQYSFITNLIPFNFLLFSQSGELATYRRIFGRLRDQYVLTREIAQFDGVDVRLLVAFLIALDALQDR